MDTLRLLAIGVLAASAVVMSTGSASAVAPDYRDTRVQGSRILGGSGPGELAPAQVSRHATEPPLTVTRQWLRDFA